MKVSKRQRQEMEIISKNDLIFFIISLNPGTKDSVLWNQDTTALKKMFKNTVKEEERNNKKCQKKCVTK